MSILNICDTKEIYIILGSDHRGVDLKKSIINRLYNKEKYRVIDCGPFTTESVDYPDYAEKVCKQVILLSKKQIKVMGILICGTGIGMCMAANKFRNIRCALCSTVEDAVATKKHNNANVLALGNDRVNNSLALQIVNKFISTPFTKEPRHKRRIKKLYYTSYLYNKN